MHRVGGVVIYSQYPYANNKQFVSEGAGGYQIFFFSTYIGTRQTFVLQHF